MNSFQRLIATPLLAPASLFYRWGLLFDRWRKSQGRVCLPRPVVSIGNLTVGGTGKTPILIRLVQDLLPLSLKAAVLTRGYQGFLSGSTPSVASDEVSLMREKLPGVRVVAGADRVASAHALMREVSPDVFILDDGFQHWRMARNLDIVCVDATDPWGGGHMLPWGRLREPLNALGRASTVIITRSDLATENQLGEIKDTLAAHFSGPVITSRFETAFHDSVSGAVFDHDAMWGAQVVALSAIGNPRSFEANLRRSGAEVVPVRFRDHHVFTERDLDRVENVAMETGAVVVTTEKDWVKLARTRWADAKNRPVKILVARLNVDFSVADRSLWTDLVRGISLLTEGSSSLV